MHPAETPARSIWIPSIPSPLNSPANRKRATARSSVREKDQTKELQPIHPGGLRPVGPDALAAPVAAPHPDRVLRLLIVDDHPLVRAGIIGFLSKEPDLKIVGECPDGADALRSARALRPDLVLMDLSMPGLNGFEATTLLRRKLPKLRILIYTLHCEPDYLAQVLRTGAHGFMAKDSPPSELVAAVRRVGHGGTHFDATFAEAVVRAEVASWGRTPDNHASVLILTPRERDVLKLIAEGLSTKEIAAQCIISVRTVETHRENIAAKLGIRSVAGLTRFAIAEGLVSLH